MKNYLKVLSIVLTSIIITSCSSDDDTPPPINEEEVITTVIATFVPQGGGTNVVLLSTDLDGDGPNDPVIVISGPFANNTAYTGTVRFLNELESPAEDITLEVEEEALEHQVFYSTTNDLGTFTYNDSDSEGNPIGLIYNFQSNNVSNGNITVTLRHEPNKDGEGVSDGDITNAGGETDVQVTFNVEVQ